MCKPDRPDGRCRATDTHTEGCSKISMADKEAQNGFGWAPVGARLLREFSQTAAPVESGPTVRYAKTWTEIKALPIMKQLLVLSTQQMILLHAVDTLPRGKYCQLLLPTICLDGNCCSLQQMARS